MWSSILIDYVLFPCTSHIIARPKRTSQLRSRKACGSRSRELIDQKKIISPEFTLKFALFALYRVHIIRTNIVPCACSSSQTSFWYFDWKVEIGYMAIAYKYDTIIIGRHNITRCTVNPLDSKIKIFGILKNSSATLDLPKIKLYFVLAVIKIIIRSRQYYLAVALALN